MSTAWEFATLFVAGEQRVFFSCFVFLPFLREMAQDISHLARTIATSRHGNLQGGTVRANALGAAGASLGIQYRSTHHVNSDNLAVCPQLFAVT